MASSIRFSHTCGHFGIGILIPFNNHTLNHEAFPHGQQAHTPYTSTTRIAIPYDCPFCTSNLSRSSTSIPSTSSNSASRTTPNLNIVPEGSGILCLLTCAPELSIYATPSHSNIWHWLPLRICSSPDPIPSDVIHVTNPFPIGFRYLAWIPKPCGTVRLIFDDDHAGSGDMGVNGTSGRRTWEAQTVPKIRVKSAWSERIGGQREVEREVQSRFAGLVSQLYAALVSGEMQRRYD